MTIGPLLVTAVATLAAGQAAPPAAPPPAARTAPAAETPKLPFELFRLDERPHRHPARGPRPRRWSACTCSTTSARRTRSPGAPASPTCSSTSCSRGPSTCRRVPTTRLLDAAGGEGNGGTAPDSTVYWEQVPSNALEQVLFVESERMGFLLPTLTQAKLDNQRDVVRNERRENFEMRPYGLALERILAGLWNPEFPYHWETIGTHEDLEAATLADVREFFERWYGPENAVLSIAGDIDAAETRRLVQKWFAGIPGKARAAPRSGPSRCRSRGREAGHDGGPGPAPPPLPRLADAEGLRARRRRPRPARGSPHRRQERAAREAAGDGRADRAGGLGRAVEPGARGHVPGGRDAEAGRPARAAGAGDRRGAPAPIAKEPPTAVELERAKNKIEAGAVFGLEPVGGFGGRAATLANYYVRAGDPGYLEQDLARYRIATAEDVSEAARRFLRKDARVVLTVVPARRRRRARRRGERPMIRRSHLARLSSRSSSRSPARRRPRSRPRRPSRRRPRPPRRPRRAGPGGPAPDRSHVPPPGPAPELGSPRSGTSRSRTGSRSGWSSTTACPSSRSTWWWTRAPCTIRRRSPALASFTAAMLTEGTPHPQRDAHLRRGRLPRRLASARGAGQDAAFLSGSSLSRHLPKLLDVFADVAMNPAFPAEGLRPRAGPAQGDAPAAARPAAGGGVEGVRRRVLG